jgi:hypothetical protein
MSHTKCDETLENNSKANDIGERDTCERKNNGSKTVQWSINNTPVSRIISFFKFYVFSSVMENHEREQFKRHSL